MDFKQVFKMSNDTYDKLKFIALIILPAAATFCSIVTHLYEISGGDKFAALIMAVDWLLGTILGVSSSMYKKE